ncbi:MAG: FAD-binding protein [Sphingobacteriaceae bacterium]|nr:FAD-binding protein [Sphingobacteriaceae bacterium]
MSQTRELVLPPQIAFQEDALAQWLAKNPPFGEHIPFRLLRRSIDARGRQVKVRLLVEPVLGETPALFQQIERNVAHAPEIHIIGAGPAGLFAALECISLGYRPIVLERGKAVRDRRRDLVSITREGQVNDDSNYCFGEGGAGTYSDGKLYTRASKRGDVRKVLEQLVFFGAHTDILLDAHPHIGTNKLPGIIEAIRNFIIHCGGEVHFNSRVTAIRREQELITAIQLHGKVWVPIKALLVATGHSARDVFEWMNAAGIPLEAKPFAMGVRIEHPQSLIDNMQYHCDAREAYLPPASYSIVHQASGRGVYSFCMCPGGIIAPCATSNGEVVTNGWSPSKRNNPFANSGFVVELRPEDALPGGPDAFGLLRLQQQVEQRAHVMGGGSQIAPAQRMVDFVKGKLSNSLPDCSYRPGVKSVELHALFPGFIHSRLQEAFQALSKKMPAYYTNEAILVGPESRTSSPVRIPRNPENRAHPACRNLFPVGEGAGYAGGIVSAAIDGSLSAAAATQFLAL